MGILSDIKFVRKSYLMQQVAIATVRAALYVFLFYHVYPEVGKWTFATLILASCGIEFNSIAIALERTKRELDYAFAHEALIRVYEAVIGVDAPPNIAEGFDDAFDRSDMSRRN